MKNLMVEYKMSRWQEVNVQIWKCGEGAEMSEKPEAKACCAESEV